MLSTRKVRISLAVPDVSSVKVSHLPFGLKELGNCNFLLWVRDLGLPAPSARAQNMPPVDWKMTLDR